MRRSSTVFWPVFEPEVVWSAGIGRYDDGETELLLPFRINVQQRICSSASRFADVHDASEDGNSWKCARRTRIDCESEGCL